MTFGQAPPTAVREQIVRRAEQHDGAPQRAPVVRPPDAHGHVVAAGDDALAVARERGLVHVALMPAQPAHVAVLLPDAHAAIAARRDDAIAPLIEADLEAARVMFAEHTK